MLVQILKSRIFIISSFSLTLLACSTQKIDGTWILSYTDSKSSIPNFSEVFTFKDGQFESEAFSSPAYYEKSNGFFELENNQLILNDSIMLLISLFDNNSMVIDDKKMSFTFKKLNDSLKNKDSNRIKFDGKTFIADIDGRRTPSIGYQKGKILFDSQSFKESNDHYKRINHNGFDIIFQEYAMPKIVKGIYGDTILLFGLHKKMHKIKMWEK